MRFRIALLTLLLLALPCPAQPPFPANWRQYENADSLERGPLLSPDQVAVKRLLLRPPAEPPRTQPAPEPNMLLRIFHFEDLQESLSEEEKLLVGLTMSSLFEYRRQTFRAVESRVPSTLSLPGNFVVGSAISAVPYLFGDGKVAEASLEAIVVASARTLMLKSLVGSERPLISPPHLSPSVEHDTTSFPSGHAAVAFAWATVLGEHYGIQWLTYPIAAAVGLARIRPGTHDLSDVLAGSLIGNQTGLESMRARGMIPARTFTSGPLDVQVDMGVEQLFDTNPGLVPQGSEGRGAGRLWSRTRGSYLVGEDVLLQGRYDTVRRVYAGLPGNNADHSRVELRLDGAVRDDLVVGVTGFRDSVAFPELGPYSDTPSPALSVATDPTFSGALLTSASDLGGDLHATLRLDGDWTVGAVGGYRAQRFVPNPSLSGGGALWELNVGTLTAHPQQGFMASVGGSHQSAAEPALRSDNLRFALEGRLALGDRDGLDLGLTHLRQEYPGRAGWRERANAVTLQYEHRLGEDTWAWLGCSLEDRSAPASGYRRSQAFLQLNGSF